MIFVLDDDLGLTKKVNPCIVVPAANSRSTLSTTISNWNWTEMQHYINFCLILHSGWFLELLYKNYLRKIPNCRYQQVTNLKINGTIVFQFQRWSNSAYIFSDFFWLVSKVEICLKYFFDKNLQNQQLCLMKSLSCTNQFTLTL